MRKPEHSEHTEHHKHDNNFKKLLRVSAREFVNLFYPKLYDDLDSNQLWVPLSEDVTPTYRHLFKDIGKNFLDKAYLVPTKKGALHSDIILLHFEFQSTEDDMGIRIRNYRRMLSHSLNKEIPIISILVGFNDFKNKQTTSFCYDFEKYGLISKETIDYDLINLSDKKWNWKDPMFYNEDKPNKVAIALWGLISDKQTIKNDGVEMMLDGYEFLSRIQKTTLFSEDEVLVPFKFLDDYILPRLTEVQVKEFEQKIEVLKKAEGGEAIVELLKVAQRGLKIKGQAAQYLEKKINTQLIQNDVNGKEKISKLLSETYDEGIFVEAMEKLESDKSGETLKNYLNI